MPIGVLTNCTAVLLGGLLGTALGKILPQGLKDNLPTLFGFCSIAIGVNSIIKASGMTAVVLAILVGFAIGHSLHIVENYFVKPSRGGYILGTLQTKKGGRRSLMNGITYGSLTEAMEAAVRNVIHDCVVSREVKNLQEVLAKAQLLKEEISANVQILNAHFPPKTLPKSEVPPTEPPVTPSGKEV